jgi:hypothetical protein
MAKGETLADHTLQFTYRNPSEYVFMNRRLDRIKSAMMQYRGWIKRANRFTLDNSLLDRMAELMTDDSAAENYMRLARLPFPVVWLEYDQHHLLKRLIEVGILAGIEGNINNIPKRAGSLMIRDDRKDTRFIAFKFDDSSARMKMAEVDSIAIMLDNEEPIAPSVRLFGCPTLSMGMFDHIREMVWEIDKFQSLLPAGLHPDQPDADKHVWAKQIVAAVEPMMFGNIQTIKDANDLSPRHMTMAFDAIAKTLTQSLRDQRGHGRMLATILAMINHIPVEMRPVEAKQGFKIMGMNKVRYMAYSNVVLKVPSVNPTRYIKRKLRSSAAGLRAHQVRGHWAYSHRKGEDTCTHDWINLNASREACTHCGKTRWWRKEHVRGDAGKGWVFQNYVVKA